jgi:hypothetical protein
MINIAVYYSGHIRNFKDIILNHKRVFKYDNIQFDFYFTFWRKNHSSLNDSWHYNNTNNINLVDICDITEEDVYKICPDAKNVVILEEHALSPEYDGYKPSLIFQLYSLYKSYELLPNTYDFYIRMRADIYFFKGIDWSSIIKNKESYELFLPDTVWLDQPNFPKNTIFNDYFWISSYETGKYISHFFKNILLLNLKKDDILERYFCKYLDNRFKILHIPIDITLERRTRGFDLSNETTICTERRLREGTFL